jgi:hypothetical protein
MIGINIAAGVSNTPIVANFVQRNEHSWNLDANGTALPRGIGSLKVLARVNHISWLARLRRKFAVHSTSKNRVDNLAKLPAVEFGGFPAPLTKIPRKGVKRFY